MPNYPTKNEILVKINELQYKSDQIFFILQDDNGKIDNIQLKYAKKLLEEANEQLEFIKEFLSV